MEYLIDLVLILLATVLFGKLFKSFGLPEVVGQLMSGVILGPSILNIVQTGKIIGTFSEIGVIILMFIAGLESNLELLKKYLKPSLIVAFMGIIFPIAFMYIAGFFHGFSNIESLFIGIIFAATSVSISVEVLREMDELDSTEGITILGAAVADDVLSILALSFAVSFFGVSDGENNNIILTILLQIAFFIFVYIMYRIILRFLPIIINKFKFGITEFSMIVCLLLAYLAEETSLSTITGAFFAGIIFSQSDFKDKISNDFETVGYSIFIPVFFANVGLEMEISGILNHFIMFIIFTILAVVTKLLGSMLGAKMSNFNSISSLEIGAGMISRGEVGLIIAGIGLSSHLISEDYYSTIIASIIATTLIAPIILRKVILIKREH
ncbi:cation:proton antiporter [Apilactobacillus apisilvae]|uniref:Cation:proton antiporter n=1 Tax=Apilactobacillus apisilvae TaxID=2923364 RepID=A0ABY4PHZ8_9LACO|nr:cation:proton antiporter [Apilactobacillus apisilvae]UQS85110.1 cation:proton antiporter [Apilactobacillus apisilvae]